MSSEQLEPPHGTDNLDGAGETTTSQPEDESATGQSTSSLSDDENTVGYCGDPACSIASCASQGAEAMVLILYTNPHQVARRWWITFEWGYFSFYKDRHIHHLFLEGENGQRSYEVYSIDDGGWKDFTPSYGLDIEPFEDTRVVICRLSGLRDEECRALGSLIRFTHAVAEENGLLCDVPEQYREFATRDG